MNEHYKCDNITKKEWRRRRIAANMINLFLRNHINDEANEKGVSQEEVWFKKVQPYMLHKLPQLDACPIAHSKDYKNPYAMYMARVGHFMCLIEFTRFAGEGKDTIVERYFDDSVALSEPTLICCSFNFR